MVVRGRAKSKAAPAMTKPIRPDFNEGVDRKELKAIISRFLELSATRMERTRESISLRQRQVLDLLPLLFHVNHPLLPGYVSRDCPYRVANYEPDEEALDAAVRFSKTFRFHDNVRHQPDVTGIFLMGSTGTVAHSGGSDFDIWLCHREDLPRAGVDELAEKGKKISLWADELGLEIHFFPMNAAEFREGRQESELDAEDCGTAQHFLLLDEFYRTNVWVAGCYPLWWLIPAEEEKSYVKWTQWLLDQRFIKHTDFIDFGNISRIPKGEFIGSGIWQLYKGIDSPYKSVLKLLLNEVYAQELPEQQCLSLVFKAGVFEGSASTVELDPYIMIYKRLENYLLTRNEMQRLVLIRKSFYLKVGIKLSSKRSKKKNWRRDAMESLVAAWEWSEKELKYLDGRSSWRIPQVNTERKAVVNELTHCYRFLSQYARQHQLKATINPEDMNLLGRKLYAAFQRKAGKVEFINPNIAPNMQEENLAFHHASSQSFGMEKKGWLLYRSLDNANDAPFHPITRRAPGLLELIVWSYYNGLLSRVTRLGLLPGNTDATLGELRNIVDSLEHILPLPFTPLSQNAYKEQSYITQVITYINIGIDPMAELSSMGMHKISSRSDSLGYSAMRENLVITLDQITKNSWNEVLVNRYEVGDTVVQCLKSTLAQISALPSGHALPSINVLCFCKSRAQAIAKRVETLFNDVIDAFFGDAGNRHCRYIIELDRRFFVIHFADGTPGFTGFDSLDAMADYLASVQRVYSPIVVDQYALTDTPWLKTVLSQSRVDAVQVFFRKVEQAVEIYVLDERSSLCRFITPYHDTHSLLLPLWRFFQSVKDRRQIRADVDTDWLDMDFLFYQLSVDNAGKVSLVEESVGDVSESSSYFEVQAIGAQDFDGNLIFDVFCDHQEFTAMEYGEQLIPAVAHFIVSRRKNGERYPCYVTDVGLPHDLDQNDYQAPNQTIQYLEYKLAFEYELNQAIKSYSDS